MTINGTFCLTITTIKYNSSLTTVLSSATYNSGDYDYATGVAVDNSGNVYVTGTSGDYYYNYFTIRYNSLNEPCFDWTKV